MNEPQFEWARTHPNGYEISTRGDSRFSALNAIMSDNRTVEMWYQCDIKGYQPGGKNWRLGKGKPPKYLWDEDKLYEMYLSVWRLCALQNIHAFEELKNTLRTADKLVLTDMFAHTPINQARAISQILNEWF